MVILLDKAIPEVEISAVRLFTICFNSFARRSIVQEQRNLKAHGQCRG